MPDRDPDVRLAIEHSIKVLGRFTLILYVAVAVVLGAAVLANRNNVSNAQEETARIDKALCAFTADLERRVELTRDLLDRSNHREPVPGITRADLRRSIQNQRMTLDSLSGLECDE